MALMSLQVSQFRCLRQLDIALDPGFTFIHGGNASGKTSILEAIYVLGRGRSFRSRQLDLLIQRGAERFVVYGMVQESSHSFGMGIEASMTGVRARIADRNARGLSELALALPVQIIDPEVHKLIEESPARRRRFLDWGVFHVEPQFAFHWQRYQQALKQRNAALRGKQPLSAITAWEGELTSSGAFISDARLRYVEMLQAALEPLSQRLLDAPISLRYKQGWNKDISLAQALDESRPHDRERGVTHAGPQRADLVVEFGGHRAKETVSRGQQKVLASAMLLAQLKLFTATQQQPVLLLDDPAAELDDLHLQKLLAEVRTLPIQLVVTSLRGETAPFGTPGKCFKIDGNHECRASDCST